MLRTDLIELVNSGEAWAFVGSGASADGGLPDWGALVVAIVGRLPADRQSEITGSQKWAAASKRSDYPGQFDAIERVIGREELERHVRETITAGRGRPGRVLNAITDWPFAGYVTTNYDGLLEDALRPRITGWPRIGNSDREIRKVSGGAKDLVWHIHGSLDLPPETSKLILTDADYDRLYLDDSPLKTQLRGFLTNHRVVFFGFSFRDLELQRLLRTIALYCNPAKPAFAFMCKTEDDAELRSTFERSNVDVVVYPSRSALPDLLKTYGAFTVRRSIRFRQAQRMIPSYDPETTGLMLFNQIVMQGSPAVAADVPPKLLRARLLALLRFKGPQMLRDLVRDLEEKARLVMHEVSNEYSARTMSAVRECLRLLVEEELVSRDGAGDEAAVSLSTRGQALVDEHSANAELESDRFRTSLLDRARLRLPDDDAAARRVAEAAAGFLKDAVRRRALGVVKAAESRGDEREFQVVALIQALPEFMQQLLDHSEATALVSLVQETLARRGEPENRYLGLALQGQFGVHLLGLDQDALKARMESFASTFFLLDASTVIHFMARSSSGHDPACLLVRRLSELGAPFATTDKLAIEVAEHARWGLLQVETTGLLNAQTAKAILGRFGTRGNQFLSGFVEEAAKGGTNDYLSYLDSAIGHGSSGASDPLFAAAIEAHGVPCRTLSEFEGHREVEQELSREVAAREIEITDKRVRRYTFRHERQVSAEAEAFVIIRAIRDGQLHSGPSRLRDAYFVSPMTAIDDLAMRPDSLLQWLNTLVPADDAEVGVIFDGLVSEMIDRDVSIVDLRAVSLAFSPLVHASKDRIEEETTREQALIRRRWGATAVRDMTDVEGLDAVITADLYFREKVAELQRELDGERARTERAVATQRMTERDRANFEQLKADKEARERRIARRQRQVEGKRRRR